MCLQVEEGFFNFSFTEMAVLLRVTVQPKKGSGEEVEEIPECYWNCGGCPLRLYKLRIIQGNEVNKRISGFVVTSKMTKSLLALL